jgi:hypothetical protein
MRAGTTNKSPHVLDKIISKSVILGSAGDLLVAMKPLGYMIHSHIPKRLQVGAAVFGGKATCVIVRLDRILDSHDGIGISLIFDYHVMQYNTTAKNHG